VTDRPLFTGENLLRELAPQVLGAVVRRHGDFAAAEDAVQEALLAASQQWPVQGLPDNPRGWLIQVASRRMVDQVRADSARRRREERSAAETPSHEQVTPAPDDTPQAHLGAIFRAGLDAGDQDDTLALLFMCCHPALPRPSAIALTLRAVGGLTTAEIAHAFMVPEPTMAQRISRAKSRIKQSGVPFRMPTDAQRDERLDAVLHVLYLIFNEGYASTSGTSLQRRDLANEAIRLTRLVHRLLPRDSEVAGLLALMLLTDARRMARSGPDGELIALPEQDRTLWDRAAIVEGTALLRATLAKGAVGTYQLQAAVAALHDEAVRHEDTDWAQIAGLYGLLMQMSDNPMVALNHAVAIAMVEGPDAGLNRLAALDVDPRVAGHYRLDAVRAHLHEMAGDPGAAIAHYQAAAAKTTSLPERNYLTTKAARLIARRS
jgi:RNA polymerase sigma factor (sigma-70 family)